MKWAPYHEDQSYSFVRHLSAVSRVRGSFTQIGMSYPPGMKLRGTSRPIVRYLYLAGSIDRLHAVIIELRRLIFYANLINIFTSSQKLSPVLLEVVHEQEKQEWTYHGDLRDANMHWNFTESCSPAYALEARSVSYASTTAWRHYQGRRAS